MAGKSLEAVRAAPTNPENMARMLALLKQVREEKNVSNESLFNCDECGINVKKLLGGARQTRYLAAAGSKGTKVIVPGVAADAQFLTIMPVTAADGGRLPLTVIVKGQEGHLKKRRPVGDSGGSWKF
eukprot:contig_14201_g3400